MGPENQQIFVNQLAGASRKTVLNVLSTLSCMSSKAKAWKYAAEQINLSAFVLPEGTEHVPAHLDRRTFASVSA